MKENLSRPGIYVLIDPRTHLPRYVGQSANLRERKRQWERGKIPYQRQNQDLLRWLFELMANDMKPIFLVLEKCKRGDLHKREKYHWKELSKQFQLTNDPTSFVFVKRKE